MRNLGRPQLEVDDFVPNDVPHLARHVLDDRALSVALLDSERALPPAQLDEVEEGERALQRWPGGDGLEERLGRDGDAVGEVGVGLAHVASLSLVVAQEVEAVRLGREVGL